MVGRVEFQNLSLREIGDMVDDVLNDNDRLYFDEDGVTSDRGFKKKKNYE